MTFQQNHPSYDQLMACVRALQTNSNNNNNNTDGNKQEDQIASTFSKVGTHMDSYVVDVVVVVGVVVVDCNHTIIVIVIIIIIASIRAVYTWYQRTTKSWQHLFF